MLHVVKFKTVIISSVFQMLNNNNYNNNNNNNNNNMHKTITFPAVFVDVKCRLLLWERNLIYKCLKTECLGTLWVIKMIEYEKYLKC